MTNRQGYFGSSRYHALAFRAEKRFGTGGLVSGHYTFSKNMTNAETLTTWLESGAGNAAAGYQTNNLGGEWSLSSFDVRHRLVLSYVMDLPFGDGKKFGANTSGFIRNLIGGWSLNGVSVFQSGFPLAFTATPNLIGYGYNLRPNVVPNCDPVVSGSALGRLTRWFNTSCFSVPNGAFVASDPTSDPRLRWKLGNEPRTDPVLRAQGVNNWNLAISKSTRLSSGINLTIRAEAFNLFNRTQFGPPNTTATTASNSTFGQVTTQQNQPRLMQLAFRLTF